MDKTDNSPNDSLQPGKPTPFYKLKTMPDGWDLSSQPSWGSVDPSTGESISSEPNIGEEKHQAGCNDLGQAQKFTQPRTIPNGWDTSALK